MINPISFKAENLEAHYVTDPKVKRTYGVTAISPNQGAPLRNYSGEIDAHIKETNQQVSDEFYSTKNKDKKTFIKVFGGIVATVFSIHMIRKIFKI